MWLPRLGHRRICRFHFVHWSLALGDLIHHVKKSDYSEATILWGGPKSMERPCVGVLVSRSQLSLEPFQSRCPHLSEEASRKIQPLAIWVFLAETPELWNTEKSFFLFYYLNFWLKIFEYDENSYCFTPISLGGLSVINRSLEWAPKTL